MSLFNDVWGDGGDGGGGFAADVLGGGFAVVEGMDSLFDKEDVTLEEVLSDPHIIEEVAARSEKLLSFLLSDDELERLIMFVEQLPEASASPTVRVKFPYLSCEVVCVGDPRLLDRVCETKHLEMLFSILDYKPEQVRANPQGEQNLGYFEKIVDKLLQQRTPRLLRFLKSAGLTVLDKLMRHLYSTSIFSLLGKLLVPGASLMRFRPEPKVNEEENPYPLWMDWTEKNAAQIVGILLRIARDNADMDAALNAGHLMARLITADMGEEGNPVAEQASRETSLTQMRQLVQLTSSELVKARLSSSMVMLTAAAEQTRSTKGPMRTCVELCLAAQAAAVALEAHTEQSTRAGILGLRLARFLGAVYELVSHCSLSEEQSRECNEVLRTANGIKALMEASRKFPDADQVHIETSRAATSVLESVHMAPLAHQLILDPAPEGPQLLSFVMESFQEDDHRLRGLAISIGQSVAASAAADRIADPTGGHECGLKTFGPSETVHWLVSQSPHAEEWAAFSKTKLRRVTAEMCHDLGGRPIPVREDGAAPAAPADDTKTDVINNSSGSGGWGA